MDQEKMIDISVIIVNWNTRQYLLDCVRTLLESKGPYTLEIIVVDNASEDGSPCALKEQFPDSEVRLIENSRNMGFAYGNNQGLRIASGRYLCLVNSDIKFLDDCISSMLTYMDQHMEIGVCGPKLLWADRTLQLSCREFPSLWNSLCPALGLTPLFPKTRIFSGEHMGYFHHDSIREVDVLVGAFLMVRRQAYEQVGGMDENYFMYCEEVDWCRRFNDAGWKIIFFPNAHVIHYGGGSSDREPTRFFREYCLSNFKYWNKYHSSMESFLFRLIFLLRQLIRWPHRFLIYMITSLLGRDSKKAYYKQKLQLISTGARMVFRQK